MTRFEILRLPFGWRMMTEPTRERLDGPEAASTAPPVPCPRCGKPCPVGPQRSAHCAACFTSFRADTPTACLTHAELVRRGARYCPSCDTDEAMPGHEC